MHYRVIGLSCTHASGSAGRMDTRRYDVHRTTPFTAEAAYALDPSAVVVAAGLAVPRFRQMDVVEGLSLIHI